MKQIFIIFLMIFCLECGTNNRNKYPLIDKQEEVDNLFGDKIIDDYRNLENLKDENVINWYRTQRKQTNKILSKIEGREKLFKNLNSVDFKKNFQIRKLVISEKSNYFYLKKEDQEKKYKLFYRKGIHGEEVVLLNPKDVFINEDYIINYINPSWDDSKIVVSFSKNDEEFSILKVLDLKTKNILEGEVINTKPNSYGGIEWLPDNSGFICTQIPEINPTKKGYRENLEAVLWNVKKEKITPNKVVFSIKTNPNVSFKPESIPITYIKDSKSNFVLGANAYTSGYRDTYVTTIKSVNSKSPVKWESLYKKEDKIKQFFIVGDTLYYRTAKNASNFKICKTSLKKPNFKNSKIVVNEDVKSTISDFTVVKNSLFYVKTTNGVDAKLFQKTNNKVNEIKLPVSSGYINVKSKGIAFDDVWIEIEGWAMKKTRYKYNYENKSFVEEGFIPVQQFKELEEVEIKEIEIASHDNVKVPLSIIYKKGTSLNSSARLLINGYGSFKWSNKPKLYPHLLEWVKRGGVYAVAHVRGGGEKGNDWHLEGSKLKKQNSWKDLIACVEYLIDNKFVDKEKITAWGASAGGVLLGKAITERPDLFSAVAIRAGVFNTLRLEHSMNGKKNAKEFGSIEDSLGFISLKNMDSYDAIKKGEKYPAVYLKVGMRDSRVSPWHSFKLAAKLQECSNSNKPILLDIDPKSGHGFESSKERRNIELANMISFLLWQTNHPEFQLME
ncbi:Prolyl oligopeptidase [Tenacibaculum sp. 190524A02b]|uniref:prolyl oligopeptidase n=2 Tax=Tenacibaculum vairaonense TaxID=3137860 RepID=A0ABM9PPY4_9FLAO